MIEKKLLKKLFFSKDSLFIKSINILHHDNHSKILY